MGAITPVSKNGLPLLKKHKNKFILFLLTHFNSCPATEKCYHLPILLKMSIGAAKTTEAAFCRGFSKLMFLKNLQNSQESACVRDSSTLSKKIVQHRCFPVNIAKFLRRDFFIEHLIKNHSKKIMPNCYVNFGSSISSYSSWGFSPAQPLLFLISFGNLGTFIMGE